MGSTGILGDGYEGGVEEIEDGEGESPLLVLFHSRGVFYFYVGVEQLVDALVLLLQRFFEVGLEGTQLALAEELQLRVEGGKVVAADSAVDDSGEGKDLGDVAKALLVD